MISLNNTMSYETISNISKKEKKSETNLQAIRL